MNKKVFLDTLSQKLCYLVDAEKNKELEKYEKVVDNYISLGQSEEEAVSSLGNVEDLIKAIYLSRGLDYSKLGTTKFTGQGFKNATKNFMNVLSGKDKKLIKSSLLYLVYLIILIILLKVIFIYAESVIGNFLSDALANVTFNKMYYLSFDIIYVICAVVIFAKMFTKKFTSL